MSSSADFVPLTRRQRDAVWSAISKNMDDDDRDPHEVIREDFNGNEDAYLRRMARWHEVNLNEVEGE